MLSVGLDEVRDPPGMVKPVVFREDRGRFLFLPAVTRTVHIARHVHQKIQFQRHEIFRSSKAVGH